MIDAKVNAWRRKHQLPESKFSVTIHHDDADADNLIVIVGKATREQIINHIYGDSYGRGANDEMFKYIDDRGVYFDLMCDAIRRFQQAYGKSKRYHIEITTDHDTRNLLGFELSAHQNK